MTMLLRALAEGFSLGASTGITCVGSCAPFLLPYLMAGSKPGYKNSLRILFQFFLGRFAAYLLFGIAAGWLGMLVRPALSHKVRAITLLVASAFMILYALKGYFPKAPFCAVPASSRIRLQSPLILGFLLGLNICPPFLVGVARLLEFGNAGLGALFFAAFFVSSSFYLLPLFAATPFLSGERIKRLGVLVSLIVGVWFSSVGILSLY